MERDGESVILGNENWLTVGLMTRVGEVDPSVLYVSVK